MYKSYFRLIIIVFLCVAFTNCRTQEAKQAKINGLSFVASKDTITQKHIEPIIKMNANWVSIMPFAFLKEKASPELYFNNERQWYGERYDGVVQSIEMMHKNGVQVMLKPQIWIGNGEFTGFIDMKNEEDWLQFENDYTEMIMLYAKLAEETKTKMFCLGTELNNFVMKRPKFWTKLIQEVKTVYSGELTYAENWDKIDQVHFWEDLDYIGVDAYFPISSEKTPTLVEVKTSWGKINEKLKSISEVNQTPILFTEFGYRSIHYAGKEPWDSKRVEGQVNEETQAILLQGLVENVWDKSWFAGGFLWKWFHNPELISKRHDNRFCVHHKIAEETLRNYFKEFQ